MHEHGHGIIDVEQYRPVPPAPRGHAANGQPTARQQAIDALGETTIETDGIGRREAGTRNIVPRATPSAAVDVAECPTEGERGHALRIWSETETLSFNRLRGGITIDKRIANYQRGPADLRLTACGDMSDFRDSTVTLAFQESSLQTPAGKIADGPPAIIQILNDNRSRAYP